jgi:hypothetical protein
MPAADGHHSRRAGWPRGVAPPSVRPAARDTSQARPTTERRKGRPYHLGALVGALIGSCIPLGWARWTRRTERRGELLAMEAELYHAKLAMTALRNANVMAALYHVPLTTFGRALPKLIGERGADGK